MVWEVVVGFIVGSGRKGPGVLVAAAVLLCVEVLVPKQHFSSTIRATGLEDESTLMEDI